MHFAFKGLYTAIPTPFFEEIENNGKRTLSIDFNSLEKIINFQIDAKVDGIVVAGSTGEAATLDIDEYYKLLKFSSEKAKGKIKIISGIGSPDTKKSIEFASISESFGFDAVMAVTPYYNKPTQNGIIEHYKAIHSEINLPIMLYSVPSRTGVDISNETIIELSKLDRILGIKDASSNIERPMQLYNKVKKEFSILSGDDALALAYNSSGAKGVVSVASNIVPKICKKIQDFSLSYDYKNALEYQNRIYELFALLFVETNPSPIKYAMSIIGLCKEFVRLPLMTLETKNKQKIWEFLKILSNNKYIDF